MDSMMLLVRRISNLSAGDGGRQEAKNRMREPKCSEPEAPHRFLIFYQILSRSGLFLQEMSVVMDKDLASAFACL